MMNKLNPVQEDRKNESFTESQLAMMMGSVEAEEMMPPKDVSAINYR